MAMVDLLTYLNILLAGGFLSLAAVAAYGWRRRGDPPSPWIAVALLCLGLLTAIGVVEDIADRQFESLQIVNLVLFMGSAYALLLFRHAILPLSLAVRLIAFVAAVAAALAVQLYPLPSGESPEYTGVELLVVLSVILVWAALAGAPTLTFWLAARYRPHVQRARLRALSGAYAALILIVFVDVSAVVGQRETVVEVATAFVIGLIPLLYAALAPPQWLRRAWRAREEDFRLIEDLAVYAADRAEIARRALDRALRLVGSDAGFIVDGGEILASRNLEPEEVTRLVETGTAEGAPQQWHESGGRHIITMPLRSETGTELMGVVAGPLAPLFGSDERFQLTRYAEVVGVALARVRLVEEYRNQTESMEALLQAISDLGEGFVVTQAGHLEFANEAYIKMIGYSMDELLEFDSLLDLSLPEERAELTERLRQRLLGGAVSDHYETAMVAKSGRVLDVEVAVKLLQTPQGPRVISIIRDITERKRAEAFRDQFIANAAHELRTPITAMVGFAALLEKRRNEMSEKELDTVSDALNRQGDRLRVLVANLLDITRLQQGKLPMELESLPLQEVLSGVLDSNPAPDGKSVDIALDDHLTVVADRLRLEQIVTNLLTNAYRYGGRSIIVRASAQDDQVTVSVVDDGRGVPRDLVPTLFEPFSRGEDSSRVGGSGLGLAIVRMMARAQGGDVWYESGNGAGANFAFSLKRQ